MLAKLARTDLEILRRAGHSPTDEQVVRLNALAIRIERGKNTTVANAPRIANAGNVVLHEPTVGALEWWHNYGRDAAWTTRGKLSTYYWMLAHACEPDAFEGLERAADIRKRVRAWRRRVFATEGELWRALLWVKSGETPVDAETAPAVVESSIEDDEAHDKLWASIIAAAGALSMRPEDLRTATRDTLTSLLVAANLHAKIPVKTSVAKDYIAYKRLLREIEERGTGNGERGTGNGENSKL